MKTCLDCIPCFLRQTIDVCRMTGMAESGIRAVLNKVSRLIPDFDLATTPPEIVVTIHRIIREETGNPDPYLRIKQESNRAALAVYPQLKAAVNKAGNRLQEAVRFAIAGNIIDYGAMADIDLKQEIAAICESGLKRKINNRLIHFPDFTESLRKAHTILYLGDNAGEIVFDKILLETISGLFPGKQLFFAVRGEPVINDCLVADALECGIDKIAEILSNGSPAPGTLLNNCSQDFLSAWEKSDLVISKGQGNFESLYKTQPAGKNIYYLFIAKCRMAAEELGCAIKEPVLIKSRV